MEDTMYSATSANTTADRGTNKTHSHKDIDDTGWRLGEFFRILVFILLVFSMLFSVTVVGRRNKLLKDEIHLMEREQQRLVEENKRLVTDISLLSNNDRIETIASQELDMHRAKTYEIRRVEIPEGR